MSLSVNSVTEFFISAISKVHSCFLSIPFYSVFLFHYIWTSLSKVIQDNICQVFFTLALFSSWYLFFSGSLSGLRLSYSGFAHVSRDYFPYHTSRAFCSWASLKNDLAGVSVRGISKDIGFLDLFSNAGHISQKCVLFFCLLIISLVISSLRRKLVSSTFS